MENQIQHLIKTVPLYEYEPQNQSLALFRTFMRQRPNLCRGPDRGSLLGLQHNDSEYILSAQVVEGGKVNGKLGNRINYLWLAPQQTTFQRPSEQGIHP